MGVLTGNQVKALLVRAALVLHCLLVVWRVTEARTDNYWILTAAIIPLLLEAAFTILRRDGVENKLFSACFFFYLAATLPGIWLLELDRTDEFQRENFTRVSNFTIDGLGISVRLSADTWVVVVEEIMLYLMILGRWSVPRGKVGREQLIQLLFGFIGIASDIMELFSLFEDAPDVRENEVLTYVILGMWSLSVLQFTLTFATAHRPRRSRGLRLSPGSERDSEAHQAHRRSVLRVELLATILSFFMQDGPFLGIRLYTMITLNVITYSLVFFTAKNVLVIMLLVYKIFLLLHKICCPKKKEDHEKVDREEADDYHGDLDSIKIVPMSDHRRRSSDLEFWDVRKRREDKDESLDFPGPNMHTRYIGDLQKVIDGPATPAKKMSKTKKYDKYMAQEGVSEGLSKGNERGKTGQCNAGLTDEEGRSVNEDLLSRKDNTQSKTLDVTTQTQTLNEDLQDRTKEAEDRISTDSSLKEPPLFHSRVSDYEQAPQVVNQEPNGRPENHPNSYLVSRRRTDENPAAEVNIQRDSGDERVVMRPPATTSEREPGHRKKVYVSIIDVKL